jgi:hypothetical protein
VHPVCETCRVLSESLLDATDKLAGATSRMAAIAGTGDHASFNAVKVEVQGLRSKCQDTRLELKRHRVQHHLQK